MKLEILVSRLKFPLFLVLTPNSFINIFRWIGSSSEDCEIRLVTFVIEKKVFLRRMKEVVLKLLKSCFAFWFLMVGCGTSGTYERNCQDRSDITPAFLSLLGSFGVVYVRPCQYLLASCFSTLPGGC